MLDRVPQREGAGVAGLEAVAEPAEVVEQVVPADPPAGKQMKIDGMPVAEQHVVLTGRIRVAQSVVERWKLGKPIEITVACIIDSRKAKVIRNGGEATGELSQQVVLQALDLVLEDDGDS
jgi:hypothetical protein